MTDGAPDESPIHLFLVGVQRGYCKSIFYVLSFSFVYIRIVHTCTPHQDSRTEDQILQGRRENETGMLFFIILRLRSRRNLNLRKLETMIVFRGGFHRSGCRAISQGILKA
jgi:hypothetical protein